MTLTSPSVPSCLNNLDNCFKLPFPLGPSGPVLPDTLSAGGTSGKVTLVHPLSYVSPQKLIKVLCTDLINSLSSLSHNSLWDYRYFKKVILLPNVKTSWCLAESSGGKKGRLLV